MTRDKSRTELAAENDLPLLLTHKDTVSQQKGFESNKMITRAISRSERRLHISEQFVGFKEPDKSTVDHSFHGFRDVTCQSNRTIIDRICWILTNF